VEHPPPPGQYPVSSMRTVCVHHHLYADNLTLYLRMNSDYKLSCTDVTTYAADVSVRVVYVQSSIIYIVSSSESQVIEIGTT